MALGALEIDRVPHGIWATMNEQSVGKKVIHVWIAQTGESLPSDGHDERPMRASNLAAALLARGHRVTIISSDFWHQKKVHRTGRLTTIDFAPRGQVVLVPSPGYRAHVGVARFRDHWLLAKEFKKVAESIDRPDIMVVGFPPIEWADEAIRLARAWRIPALLDVKDQWPEIFWERLPSPARPLGRLLLSPLVRRAARAFRGATGITTMSQPFLQWALAKAGRAQCASDAVVPFGCPRPIGETAIPRVAGSPPIFAFVGSITTSFDFATLVNGFRNSSARERSGARLVICGAGDCEDDVRRMAAGCSAIEFRGWLGRTEIAEVLHSATVGVAPYKSRQDFELSLPNKIVEYASYGLPLLCPAIGEMQSFVNASGIGFTYAPGDATSCAGAIDRAIAASASNVDSARSSVKERFEREFEATAVYMRLVDHIERVAADAST